MESALELLKINNSDQIQCCVSCLKPFSSTNVWRCLQCGHQICEKCLSTIDLSFLKCVKCGKTFKFVVEESGFILGVGNSIRIFDESDFPINVHNEDTSSTQDSNPFVEKFVHLIESLKANSIVVTQDKIKGSIFAKLFPMKQIFPGTAPLESKAFLRLYKAMNYLQLKCNVEAITINRYKRGAICANIGEYKLDLGNNIDAATNFLEQCCTKSKPMKSWWNIEYTTKLETSLLSYDFRWIPIYSINCTNVPQEQRKNKYYTCQICSPDMTFTVCNGFDSISEDALKKIATHICVESNRYLCLMHSLRWKATHLKDEMKAILTYYEMSKVTSIMTECKKYITLIIQLQYAKQMCGD
jgi:hypothetical protein